MIFKEIIMHYKNQKKYFEVLKRYENKFDSKESDRYKMLKKRIKDEEDLDRLSLTFLDELLQKYHINREKKNYDDIFKKVESSEEDS